MTYAIIALAAALAYLLLSRKRKAHKTGWHITYSPGMPARPVPDGDGWGFTFPTNPASHVHYVQNFDPPNLEPGKSIRVRFRVSGQGFTAQEWPDEPATVSLLIQRKGDDWTARGEMASYRWYSTRQVRLAEGEQSLVVPFVWTSADGVSIRRTYTFTRGSYAIAVRDEVSNDSAAPWQGYVYRRLQRVPPTIKKGMTNPDSFSFNGATWYNNGYERRAFDEDYLDDGRLNQVVEGGWLAMLQHHFFSAWIPQQDQTSLFLLNQNGNSYSIESHGPGFSVAPGQKVSTEGRLWVGPKLVDQINAQDVKGLDRVVDYSRFSIMAIIGQGLFWVMNQVHKLVGNWGWAIIGLVILLKLALFPLANAQYKSQAKMRKFQPRIAQLKERYGDDKQKFQVAMMELYKKEKINPMGGCLPLLIQMPIFFALYWVTNGGLGLLQQWYMLKKYAEPAPAKA